MNYSRSSDVSSNSTTAVKANDDTSVSDTNTADVTMDDTANDADAMLARRWRKEADSVFAECSPNTASSAKIDHFLSNYAFHSNYVIARFYSFSYRSRRSGLLSVRKWWICQVCSNGAWADRSANFESIQEVRVGTTRQFIPTSTSQARHVLAMIAFFIKDCDFVGVWNILRNYLYQPKSLQRQTKSAVHRSNKGKGDQVTTICSEGQTWW